MIHSFKKGDKVKISSVKGLKKDKLIAGQEAEIIEDKFDPFDNGGFLIDGVTPTGDVVIKLVDGMNVVISKENLIKA